MDPLKSSSEVAKTNSFPAFHATPESKPTKLTLFQRIFQAFASQSSQDSAIVLQRMHLHKEDAEKVKAQLEELKDCVLREEDSELLPMVTEVINPMLKDIERINHAIHKKMEGAPHADEMRMWTEKAKLWMALFSKNKDKKALENLVVQHIVEKSFDKIEKDIGYINIYLNKFVENLDLHPDERSELKALKSDALNKHIENLRILQIPPTGMSLAEANLWRNALDPLRSKFFNAALDEVDGHG